MQVRTFDAVDMRHALALVREEMGPGALIVSSRTVRKERGIFGFRGRRVLEVTAAVEEARREEPVSLQGPLSAELPRAPRGGSGADPEARSGKQAVDPVLDEVRAIRQTLRNLDGRPGLDPADLHADVSQIRTMLASLLGAGTLGPDAEGAAAQRLYYFLVARGIDEALARSLVQRVVARVEAGALGDLERLKLNLAAEMRADLGRAQRGGFPSRVQIFVGPTGVGKTTTIAKLAARAAGETPGGALIITTDVHRVAAVEQMVRFGETLDVPVEVAISADHLARTIAEAKWRERIFIDTAGRSHRDASSMRGLTRLIEAAGEAEVMLVMSATTRAADSREILAAYDELPCSRLILTKLDETRIHGELYNCIVRSGRPVACVTDGQAVPESLHSLDVPEILRRVLHG